MPYARPPDSLSPPPVASPIGRGVPAPLSIIQIETE